jgi:hypothetical protein
MLPCAAKQTRLPHCQGGSTPTASHARAKRDGQAVCAPAHSRSMGRPKARHSRTPTRFPAHCSQAAHPQQNSRFGPAENPAGPRLPPERMRQSSSDAVAVLAPPRLRCRPREKHIRRARTILRMRRYAAAQCARANYSFAFLLKKREENMCAANSSIH